MIGRWKFEAKRWSADLQGRWRLGEHVAGQCERRLSSRLASVPTSPSISRLMRRDGHPVWPQTLSCHRSQRPYLDGVTWLTFAAATAASCWIPRTVRDRQSARSPSREVTLILHLARSGHCLVFLQSCMVHISRVSSITIYLHINASPTAPGLRGRSIPYPNHPHHIQTPEPHSMPTSSYLSTSSPPCPTAPACTLPTHHTTLRKYIATKLSV